MNDHYELQLYGSGGAIIQQHVVQVGQSAEYHIDRRREKPLLVTRFRLAFHAEERTPVPSQPHIVEVATKLADIAAFACTQPRAFHANEGGMQQALSRAVAQMRVALAEASVPTPIPAQDFSGTVLGE